MTYQRNETPEPLASDGENDKADLVRRQKEDFDFLVMCQMKGNMGMYDLFRDRSLDEKK